LVQVAFLGEVGEAAGLEFALLALALAAVALVKVGPTHSIYFCFVFQ
jgi:hypothetical protein